MQTGKAESAKTAKSQRARSFFEPHARAAFICESIITLTETITSVP